MVVTASTPCRSGSATRGPFRGLPQPWYDRQRYRHGSEDDVGSLLLRLLRNHGHPSAAILSRRQIGVNVTDIFS